MKFLNSKFHILNSRDAFTIVELLVALSVFSIIVTIAIGGFTQVLRIQRQLQAVISANNNAGLVIEQMAREIRTGHNFCDGVINVCPPSPTPTILKFTNANGENVTYQISTPGILTRDATGGSGPVGPQPINSSNVFIQSVRFWRFGVGASDTYPPRITIDIGVSPNEPTLINIIQTNLQTTISARGVSET